MATIEEALRAARGTVRVSAAKAAKLHALLTDLNYHTEAGALDARQHGLHRIAAELDRIADLRDQRGSLRGLSDDGVPLRDKRDALIAEIEAHKDGEDRTGNPYGGRAENPPKKPVTVRFKPAELKAIAEQRGATYFVQELTEMEATRPGAPPGWLMAQYLTRCKRFWEGLPGFYGAEVDIEPLNFDKNKLAKSLSVTARVNPDDATAMSAFAERYVPIIVNGWIDAENAKLRDRAELRSLSRTGNPRRR